MARMNATNTDDEVREAADILCSSGASSPPSLLRPVLGPRGSDLRCFACFAGTEYQALDAYKILMGLPKIKERSIRCSIAGTYWEHDDSSWVAPPAAPSPTG